MGTTSFKHHTTLIDWPIRRNVNVRKCLVTCIALSLVIIFFYYTQYNVHNFEEEFVLNYSRAKLQSDYKKYLIHTSKCHIPNLDPFNEDVKKYFHRENYVPCSTKKLLSYIEQTDDFVTLHINQTLLTSYSFLKISCCFSSVNRVVETNRSDNKVSFSECRPFEGSVNITDFIVMVRCSTPINFEVYSNVHSIITPQHITEKKRKGWNPNSIPYSVLLVGIDSMSKLNLVRTMPKTYRFLEEHDFLSLKGYTKVGDNTFPNLMAILTGKTWEQVYKHCDPFKNRLNICDIIWDRFSDLGYITAYAEDETQIGTFNYNRQGFAEAPTDFYFRPYAIAAEKLPSIKRFGMHTCSGPESSAQRIMNLAKDFTVLLKNYPKFGLFWMNTFSHDNINLPSSMDAKVEKFLEEIYDHLDNTILIFFSDHGFRFGDIRYTHTGYIEERLPFIYIHIPKILKQRHPKGYKNFLINTKRLSTPFDVHMTLQDVLVFANQSYTVQPSLACPKCHSLFKEIQESRTCKDGAIAQHWCLCSGRFYVSLQDPVVIDAAEYIVTELNAFIKSSKVGHKCAHYFFKRIISASVSEKYLNERNKSVSNILIMLETRPPAMFEATVEVGYELPRFRLLAEISRVNKYADNSKCIEDTLKKYCYCDGLFTSIKSAICSLLNCV